ncbi:hypothetical protein APHAL10511_004793 [Amanita phalloides]|nr:hypothetical protein APHAL10511_004793 [Amanita phalloides]
MSTAADDEPPKQSYQYFWSAISGLSIDEFVAKYRPSMVRNDGTKPWLWVEGSGPNSFHDGGREAAVLEAKNLLNEYTIEIENIKNDSSIPIRSNKKTGAKSKKEVREQLQAEAAEKLKDIAHRHNFFTGKWLMFTSPEKVDVIWSTLAKSIVSGPLASSSAQLAKVSTSPKAEAAHYQHIICVYLPNIYDKEDVTAVMKILIRNHGFYLNGVKSDLYTLIGLDSKHSSGIQSTIWKNMDLLKEDEMKELRDAFFAEGAEGKGDKTRVENAGKTVLQEGSSKKVKPKPVLKKSQDDPFMSDDDQNEENETEKKLQTKGSGTTQKRPRPSDDKASTRTRVKKSK